MPTSVPRALERYRAKRHFDRTPEPAGARRRSSQRLEFVIQRHHARRLHYDFRLEWDGVLKSWAVPKGPSLDPAEKRLAVQVEDHPFEYRTFAGDIPKGEYGAGHVIIWDRGHWTPEGDVDAGMHDGKLDFALEGERLRGRWTLVRLKDAHGEKANWLLIKRRDEHADAGGPEVTELYTDPVPGTAPQSGASSTREGGASEKPARSSRRGTRAAARSTVASTRAEQARARSSRRRTAPVFIPPQLATSVDTAPSSGRWLTELKFDGYRIVAWVDAGRVHCYTRSGHDWTHRIPHVSAALADLGLRDAWLDGELVAVDERGIPQFQRLQQALDPHGGERPLFMVFDALQLSGADLRAKPQRERKRLLQQALADLPPTGPLRLVDFVDGDSVALREQACAQGYEGVILKDAEADYRSGRNRAWLKLKCRREQEFVIGGYTRTAAGRDTLTALLLGYHDERGRLRFAGRAGSGFSGKQLAALRQRLDRLAAETAPFADPPKLRGKEQPQWVRPELVAQVRFAEWTESGILRQPLFLGLREDIGPAGVRREPDRILDSSGGAAAESRGKSKVAIKKTNARSARSQTPRAARKTRAAGKAPVARATRTRRASAPAATAPSRRRTTVQLTNPQRVLYPTDGVTKQQLAEYYEAIAPVLWPHLKARPLSLIRATSAQGRVFFQRHIDGDAFPGLKPVTIPGSDEEPYFVCRSLDSIPLLAQVGAVELHTWGSHVPHAERADRLTFDLDPDPALPWPRVREAATLVRQLLEELGLRSRLKTSGGLGLHVVVPLAGGPPMEVAATFSRRVAEHLARLIPQRFSARRGAANRQGKVYVDWQRNQFAATTVSAYSPRHRAGVPVSLPVSWDELGSKDIRAAWFNLRNVAARIADRGDAWADEPPLRQTLTQRVIDRLEAAAA
ncbi:MAG TPA: DNA ligase D [Steroidobacteraceae bacterium]|nr:DNA ligase D [Steroidobacteraceae bacterium]